MSAPSKPLVVQADRTVLLEVHHPNFAEARDRLGRFAELEKSPEHVHFYRITPISIWNAAALGEPLAEILDWLEANARYPVAASVLDEIRGWYRRYGLLRLLPGAQPDRLSLHSTDASLLDELVSNPTFKDVLTRDANGVGLAAEHRGTVKQALIKLGYPVDDRAGYQPGAPLSLSLRARAAGRTFALRDYQRRAAEVFHAGGSAEGGCGVLVLPCGAGKTVVGMGVMELLQTRTLILSTNTVAVRQWRRELLEKTSLTADQIGEYTGEHKAIRPVTIATYQILTHRNKRTDPFSHFALFDRGDWGLVIYDEVHLLPAPVFRATAAIQARRRLGLTATLVREDGKEDEVFSLIGPKRFEVPWKVLEARGHLAAACCIEVRVGMSHGRRQSYLAAARREQFRIASLNERKTDVLAELLRRHQSDQVLVIGQYLDQLHTLAAICRMPLITGRTPNTERERLYDAFRNRTIRHLMVSKVGNFAIDLPDANVAIQISGTFGSRQEEAQRLGRILRPKQDRGPAIFYSLVTEDSREQDFANHRQLFLTEQGYTYEILHASAMLAAATR